MTEPAAARTATTIVHRHGRWIWLVAVLMSFVLWPTLTRNIAVLAYDAAMEHVPRGVVFSQAISDGVLYPRWTQFLHWGLGSPLFTFQPPLPYYGLDLLYRLGVAHPIGWRLLMAAGLLTAFAGAYLLLRAVTGQKWPAVVAGAAYMYAPYVIRDALERGSNEAYGVFLYPWVLWGVVWVARRPSVARFAVATLAWAACIASHVLAPLMLLPFALAAAAYLAWRHRSWSPPGVLLAGALLTAAAWMPMIPEQGHVHVERDFSQAEAVPARNPIPLDALLAPPAVYDTMRDNNGTGDRFGVVQAVVLIAGLPATAIAWARRRHAPAAALGACTLAGLLLFWMLTAASDPLWNMPAVGPLLAHLLYRTRLMGVLSLAAACTAGALVALFSTRRRRIIGLALAGLLILAALPSLYVEYQHRYGSFEARLDLADVRAIEIATGGKALTAFGEFTPRWRTAPFDQALLHELGTGHNPQQKPLRNSPDEIQVRAARVTSSAWDLEVIARQATTVTFYLLYYPRWRAWLDGGPAMLRPEADSGYAQLDLPAGRHRIALRYGRTAAESTGLVISGLSLLALLGMTGWVSVNRLRHGRPLATGSPGDRAESDHSTPPPVWLLSAATAFLVLKFAYIDGTTTWLRCTSTPTRVCEAQATVNIPFPGGPRLRGYAVSSYKAAPGQALRVTLFWQGETGQQKRLASFVHVRNSQPNQSVNPRTGSDIWAQADQVTPGGLPTEAYKSGRLYKDDHRVALPEDMPAGEYYLEVGLADPATGEQLDPEPAAVQPPLRILWRSVLLPSVSVR